MAAWQGGGYGDCDPGHLALGPLKITKVRPILTAPHGGIRFVVVKVETSEPGLYGLGCATFNQRPADRQDGRGGVPRPLCTGRDADDIEDLWQNAYTSSYWRNGPVLNNALSGLDQALWDIKGKRANMPVYQLLGGKCRFAVTCYTHSAAAIWLNWRRAFGRTWSGASGTSASSGAATARRNCPRTRISRRGLRTARGWPHGCRALPAAPCRRCSSTSAARAATRSSCSTTSTSESRRWTRSTSASNWKVPPVLHRGPVLARGHRLLQDAPPADGVPIAMGELFNSPHEWVGLISERLIDFIRVHISQVGGLSVGPQDRGPGRVVQRPQRLARPGRRLARRPRRQRPPGPGHLELRHPGGVSFNQATREVFPGSPTLENGYMHINEAPGFGVDLNEDLAAKYPLPENPGYWQPVRRPDGTAVRP